MYDMNNIETFGNLGTLPDLWFCKCEYELQPCECGGRHDRCYCTQEVSHMGDMCLNCSEGEHSVILVPCDD